MGALVLLAACSRDDARGPSTFSSSSPESEPPPPIRQVDEAPSGPCSNEGTKENVQTPAGIEVCREHDAQGAAVVPNVWLCTCRAGQWTCEIVDGGFGAMSCP